ncbi:retrovirus-related pol polyprotein from transposon TNT 1-94 [Tanacetum coccineum]
MAAVNYVPQLVDKKGGEAKPESQWTPDEKRVVVQDQRLKSIIMSCLPDDIMEYVISCVSAKETWTGLVHIFEGPLDTKENRIMDLKLEYQTFRAKFTESISQTYTCYKTLLNELANDGVNLSKHEINIGFINSLPEKWLTFSQGLRNANHTQTLNLSDIYGRSSEEYLRDLDIEYHERALLENSKRFIKRRNNFSGQKANENTKCYQCGNKCHFARDCFSKTSKPSYKSPVNHYSLVSKGFQPKFTPKLMQSSSNSNSQADPKFQKDYKVEYKKMKSKLALLEASPSKVSDQEDVTQVKVLMALADDELHVRKSHARNGDWVGITIRKVNTLISMDEDADWQNYLNEQIPHQKKKVLGSELLTESLSKININENAFIPASMGHDQEMVPKTKDWVERLNPDSKLPNFNTGRILVPESQVVNESLETLNTPKSSKDFEVEFLTPLPPLKNLQGASPSLEVMPLTFQPHSPKERPGLGIMKHTKPETQDSSNKSVSGTVTVSETKQTTPSVPTEVKDTEQELKINELTKLVQMLIDEKVNSNQKNQESNSKIQKTESSKSVDSSEMSQDSKFKVQSTGLSKSLRPNPIKKPQLKCELSPVTLHLKPYALITLKEVSNSAAKAGDTKVGCAQKKLNRQSYYCVRGRDISGSLSVLETLDAQGFDDKQGIIFNANKEIVLIAPRRNDVYVLDVTVFASSSLWTCLDKMVENQNDVKVKQIKTDNGTKFRNHELESFCDEKGISQKFSSPYTPEQNGVAKRRNRTLIEAARTMLNGSVLSKHFWTDDISISNAAFRVYNTRRQQIEKTYHVTFDESMEAIRFTNTSVDEIDWADSPRSSPDEFQRG